MDSTNIPENIVAEDSSTNETKNAQEEASMEPYEPSEEIDTASSTFFTGIDSEEGKESIVIDSLQSLRTHSRQSAKEINIEIEQASLQQDSFASSHETNYSREGRRKREAALAKSLDWRKVSKTTAHKYFGAEAKLDFDVRSRMIKNQRAIVNINSNQPMSPQILYALSQSKKSTKELKQSVLDSPFSPDRQETPLKVNTRVIIRTQSLAAGESYSQMQLVEHKMPKVQEAKLGSSDIVHEASNLLPQLGNLKLEPLHLPQQEIQTTHSLLTPVKKGKLPPIDDEVLSTSNSQGNTKSDNPSKLLSQVTESKSTVSSSSPAHSKTPLSKLLSPVNDAGKKVENRHGPVKSSLKKTNSAIQGKADKKTSSSGIKIVDPKEDDNDSDLEETTMFTLAQLYKEKLIKEDKNIFGGAPVIAADESGSSGVPQLELVCIDYRDEFNHKVADRLKNNSLFKYIEGKLINRHFYDDYDSDRSDPEDEMAQLEMEFPLKSSAKSSVASSSSSVLPQDDHGVLSPRSMFIDNCIRQKLNPRASLILRKSFSRILNLKHLGMGNEVAVLLAEAIVNVPYIEALNVCDNNLTDKGLKAIVDAICHMKELTDLDMSFNEIGPDAAGALEKYLCTPTCPLKHLILEKADVDDDECRDFVQSLHTNQFLIELDLSDNKVGSSENLNTVMPDLITGGEALAELLRSETCPLETLKLGWNMIRLDGAIEFCESLALNKSLTYLDLSYNSLSSNGGIALGNALQDNHTLKTLLIANNALDSVAIVTICAGMLLNEQIKYVCFDGNPIGEQGASSLMLLPNIVGDRIQISAKTCNIYIVDSKNWFDSSSLVRKFELDLSDSFARAVAVTLVFTVPAHQTYVIVRSEYFDPEKKEWIDIKLKEITDPEAYKKKPHDPENIKMIQVMRDVIDATEDTEKALALFKEIDIDGSNELDELEFKELLGRLGIEVSDEKVRDLMAEYDVDGGGLIELSEFLLFLNSQRKESIRRLKELTEHPVLVSEADGPVDVSKLAMYIPPRVGILRLDIVDGFAQKETYRVMSPADRANVLRVAQQSGESVQMAVHGVKHSKVPFEEALMIVDTLLQDNSNKIQVLASVLPRVNTPADVRLLISKVIETTQELARLKREIGQAYRVMIGLSDGYYSLDMGKEIDRFCVNRLLDISTTTSIRRSQKRQALGYGRLGDTSQKGNFSCFRNEMFNHKPIVLDTQFATPLPRSGKLEFDFVSQRRVQKDEFILNDVKFTNVCIKNFLLNPAERAEAMNHLSVARHEANKCLAGDGVTINELHREISVEYGSSATQHKLKQDSLDIGLASSVFYSKLSERTAQIEKYRSQGSIKTTYEHDPAKIRLLRGEYARIYKIPRFFSKEPVIEVVEKPSKKTAPEVAANVSTSAKSKGNRAIATQKAVTVAEAIQVTAQTVTMEDMSASSGPNNVTSTNEVSSVREERRKLRRMSTYESLGEKQLKELRSADVERRGSYINEDEPLPDAWNKFICLLGSRNISMYAKATRVLEVMLDAFENLRFYSRHLELLVIIFGDFGTTKTSGDFGTFRVDLVVFLFPCLVDIHNAELFMRRLTPIEVACVTCRIGILNLFNPMKPEGSYELDLSRRDERVVVKMLAQLSVVEPGDNLPFLQFRWERDMAPMPGYELTEPFLTEVGLPNKGLWNVTYYSGEGKGKKNCKPVIKFRRALLQLTLIDEEDIVYDGENKEHSLIDPDDEMSGADYIKSSNPSTWIGYLAYNEDDFKALKGGGGGNKGANTKK